ncbi:MAG: MotA/TolQ/ExbB proton channel family protein [Deltaproteobacteria bacterium]|nr:MotA/TolQ/ExbB proton channel family protein [Deltaproteobacteria bacterium]
MQDLYEMRYWMGIMILCAILIAFPVAAEQGDRGWESVVKELEASSAKSLSRTEIIRELMKRDKIILQKTVAVLKARVSRQQRELSNLQTNYKQLLEQEQHLKEGLKAEEEEIKTVQGTVFGAAKQGQDLFEGSTLGSEFVEQRAVLDRILEKKHFPGMDEIRAEVALFARYSDESARIRKHRGEFVNYKGHSVQGDIVHIGGIGAVYSNAGKVGYLKPVSRGRELAAIAGDLGYGVRKALKAFIEGDADHVLVDISGGAVFLELTQKKSFREWIQAGGLLVWPIFGIGALALLFALERLFFFFRIRSNSDKIIGEITSLVENDRIDECKRYCREKKNYPTCQILGSGLDQIGATQEVLESSLQEAILRFLPRFERFIPTLGMLAAVAPLLGLLGTVSGMINTFQVITIFGTGDPKLMAGGISEALITTELGLAVAIPVMLIHHFFERRVELIVSDMEEKATAFTLTILKLGKILPKETSP